MSNEWLNIRFIYWHLHVGGINKFSVWLSFNHYTKTKGLKECGYFMFIFDYKNLIKRRGEK